MKRASLIVRLLVLCVAIAFVSLAAPLTADGKHHGSGRFDLVETSIAAEQQAIENKVSTSEQLVHMYLRRIAAYDGKDTATHLNSYIHVNDHALRDAQERDEGRAPGHQKRALFGIPMILKDNIDTKDMPTTAGSVAFAGSRPRSDAFIARKLREAGAIILGKATMTEFARSDDPP